MSQTGGIPIRLVPEPPVASHVAGLIRTLSLSYQVSESVGHPRRVVWVAYDSLKWQSGFNQGVHGGREVFKLFMAALAYSTVPIEYPEAANDTLSWWPIIHLRTYCNEPVSRSGEIAGFQKTILWSDLPRGSITSGTSYNWPILVHILSKIASWRVPFFRKTCTSKTAGQRVKRSENLASEVSIQWTRGTFDT